MKTRNNVLIIAEAGVNHNGDINVAFDLINAAAEAGADIIKFQTFNPDSIVTSYSRKADYQKSNELGRDENQLAMLKRLRLNSSEQNLLVNKCNSLGIEFLSTGFDLESLDFLERLDMKRYKIPSGEITNLPYLRRISKFKKPIIMSTGMASHLEIKASLDVLYECGCTQKEITLLQCTSEYPAPIDEINLSAMKSFKRQFNVEYGISDHSDGIEVSIGAAALGASIIEKHITLDRNLPGPDHKASIEPDLFRDMVIGIRKIEKALGDDVKKITKSEIKNKLIVRKSLVASKDIKKGEIFTMDNIGCKRPGYGISPMRIDEIIGCISKRDYYKDEMIEI